MKQPVFKYALIWVVLLITSCTQSGNRIVGTVGNEAMVVSAHPLATEVGLNILKDGGNAVDAAIATQFALAVVYPRAGNIGGGGFAIVRLANGQTSALDFRERAPLNASRTMYQDSTGDVINGLSTRGHLAIGVPGSVAGMWQLYQKYGTLEWSELVQPAIDIAFDGLFITKDEAEALNEKQEDFVAANTYTPWVVRNSGWNAGDEVIQPQLAATLSFIRDYGRDGFYKGIVADQIVDEMKRGGGLIDHIDLERYEATWRDPLRGTYKGHEVITMPPTSSGGVALIQLLQGAEQHDLGDFKHNSTKAVHLMAELERRVFADRARHLGDMDFYDVPISGLISEAYNRNRFANISMNAVSASQSIDAGQPPYESSETTHFSIVDPEGNAVSLTTTLNLNYGSKVWVKDAGFVLNCEMDDFSAKPGEPNYFGLIGNEANAIQPGKRMLSAMTPAIVEKDGELKIVVGTPGGATIITTVFQTIINVIDHDMTMQESVNAKKVHHQWLPDQIKAEEGALTEKTIRELKEIGHHFEFVEKIGRSDCILVREDGSLEGGADPRGDDFAMGF